MTRNGPARSMTAGSSIRPQTAARSMAGKAADGGLRSYASMTYAGLKSMIYAGLGRDDPRVKAALAYIKRHYTLDENPGLGQQGLYYFYHTFAKTMFVLGEPTLTDSAGTSHDWRAELDRGPGQAAAAARAAGSTRRIVSWKETRTW